MSVLQIQYHEDFEKSKGKVIQVADTVEMQRHVENTKNFSSVLICACCDVGWHAYMYFGAFELLPLTHNVLWKHNLFEIFCSKIYPVFYWPLGCRVVVELITASSIISGLPVLYLNIWYTQHIVFCISSLSPYPPPPTPVSVRLVMFCFLNPDPLWRLKLKPLKEIFFFFLKLIEYLMQ